MIKGYPNQVEVISNNFDVNIDVNQKGQKE